MVEIDDFKHVDSRLAQRSIHASVDPDTFFADLETFVNERFMRMTQLPVVTVPLDTTGLGNDGGDAGRAVHPICKRYSETEYCRGLWKRHLSELKLVPEAHWHKCKFGVYCAVVPVVWQRRCLAACKLACRDTIPEEQFERHIELLDVLVENFVLHKSELHSRLSPPEDSPHQAGADKPGGGTRHPKVAQACEHIEKHLTDPSLTVAGIARFLDMNSTYLAHLFSLQVGVRMSSYIASRRISLAEKLLATTKWQIKRVAYESGHTNPNWFSHVFHAHTGLTPGEFRRRASGCQDCASSP